MARSSFPAGSEYQADIAGKVATNQPTDIEFGHCVTQKTNGFFETPTEVNSAGLVGFSMSVSPPDDAINVRISGLAYGISSAAISADDFVNSDAVGKVKTASETPLQHIIGRAKEAAAGADELIVIEILPWTRVP